MGKYDEALSAFDGAIAINESDLVGYVCKSNLLQNMNKNDEAIVLADKIIKMDNSYTSAYISKGEALRNLHRYDEAIKVYDQILIINESNIPALLGKAVVFASQKKYNEALDNYDKIIQLDPTKLWAWNERGGVLQSINRHEEAIRSFDHVIALNERNAPAWHAKAISLQNLKRTSDALNAYDQAIVNDPQFYWAWMDKGDLLVTLKNYKDAIDAFDKAIQINSSDPSAWIAKGNTQMKYGKYSDALANFEQALKLNPNLSDIKTQIETAQFKIFLTKNNESETQDIVTETNVSIKNTPIINGTTVIPISSPKKDVLSTVIDFFFGTKPTVYSSTNYGTTNISNQILLNDPVSVFLQNNTIFIVDKGNKSIIGSDYTGRVTLNIGGPSHPDLFIKITSVTVDKQGNIFVLDAGAEKVFKFDYAGRILISWGTHGSGPGQFDQPSQVSYVVLTNPMREVVSVVDTGNKRIQFFDPDGQYVSSLSTFFGSYNILVDNKDGDQLTIGNDNQVYPNITREEANPPYAERTITIQILETKSTLPYIIDRGLYLGAQKNTALEMNVNEKLPEQWTHILTAALRDPVTVATIENVSEGLRNIASDNKLTDSESLDLLCTFIQQISLVNETEHRYPIEVLHDKKATSFDKALFLYGLLYQSGYDVVFLAYPGTNHCAVGIRVDKSIEKPVMKVYPINTKSYVYINPDKPDLIGRINSDLNGVDPTIVRLMPQDENHFSTVPELEKRLVILETLDGINKKLEFLSTNKNNYLSTERAMANADINKIKSVITFIESNTWNIEGISMRIKNSKVSEIQINYKAMSQVESTI